jgi:hypothetical protein
MIGMRQPWCGYPSAMGHSGRLQVLASLLAVGSLAACTSSSTDGAAPQQPARSSSPSAVSGPSNVGTKPPVLRCQDPSASVEEMAMTAIAPHPGPLRASTLVRAATTSTGTWYVIGVDRAYVLDTGTLTGRASRSLALTNAPVGVSFIPLGDGLAHRPFETSWDRVSWTGRRLAAGQRALRRAVRCLDVAAADKS